MTDKNLFDAIGQISPEYILEASPDNVKKRSDFSLRWIPVAACLCIAIFAILIYPQIKGLPTHSVTEPDESVITTAPSQESDMPSVTSVTTSPTEISQSDEAIITSDSEDGTQDTTTETDAPVTTVTTEATQNMTTSDGLAIGGSDPTYSRKYIDEVYNIYIGDETVGREISDRWVQEVFLKRTPFEQEALPPIYQMIVDLKIPKEALEITNALLGGDELSQETIDALYLEDIFEMMKALTNPHALYHNGAIYTLDELRFKKCPEIPKDILIAYFEKLERICEEEGTLKYDLELIDQARLTNEVY